MNTYLLIIVQLALVTIVYIAAYRAGYKASMTKAQSILEEFVGPANEMVDAIEHQLKRATDGNSPKP